MSQILRKAVQILPKVTREVAGAKDVDMFGDYRKNYKFKTKFGLLGPVSAGKSTLCAGIVFTCQDQSATVANFYARVLGSHSSIGRDANNLRIGRFPDKTDPTTPQAPEAGLLICQKGMISNNGVWVPICDVAGEVSDYLNDSGEGNSSYERISSRSSSINRVVIDTVRDCQGFIIALDANDAILFRKSPDALDSDDYMHSVLTNIFEWRRRNNKPDPHIIVVLTKWDEVSQSCKDLQMDAYDGENGLQRFLDNGFPSLSMLLKPLRDKNYVRFFRSWFTLAKDEEGNTAMWPNTTKPKIKINENERAYIRFKPEFSEPDYIDLINYIGTFS
jgi:hypothetical protein